MNTATRVRRPADYGAYTDGANALKIDHLAPPVETPAVTRRPRRTPWVTDVTEPTPTPVAAPVPVALPRAPFLILMVALVVVGVLGVLVLNTKINENSFRL